MIVLIIKATEIWKVNLRIQHNTIPEFVTLEMKRWTIHSYNYSDYLNSINIPIFTCLILEGGLGSGVFISYPPTFSQSLKNQLCGCLGHWAISKMTVILLPCVLPWFVSIHVFLCTSWNLVCSRRHNANLFCLSNIFPVSYYMKMVNIVLSLGQPSYLREMIPEHTKFLGILPEQIVFRLIKITQAVPAVLGTQGLCCSVLN